MDIPRQDISRKKRNRRFLGVAGFLAGLAIITIGIGRLKPATPKLDRNMVWVDTVKRGPMLRQVRGIGVLVPEAIRWITAQSRGRIENIDILPGAAVKAGTVILELSNPELRQEALNAYWQLKAAEAELTGLKAQLEGNLLEMKSALSKTERQYKQAHLETQLNEELFGEGLVSELVFKTSQLQAEQLVSQWDIEKQRFAFQKDSMEPQLAAQRAKIEQYRARDQLLADQVKGLMVRASRRGVLQRLDLEVGEQVAAGQNLALVSDPRRLKAVIQIPEVQAKDVRIGLPTTIDTRNGIIKGEVIRVDPAVRNGTVAVDVKLDSVLPKGARSDLTVEGSVELENLPNVVYVGRPAFGKEESEAVIFKFEGSSDLAVRTLVRFGRGSVSAIEILDGLVPGDRVILSDTSEWDHYDRLRVN